MSAFRPFDVSSQALSAERMRLEVHLSNLANQHTTRTPEGGPYRPRQVVFESEPSAFDQTLQSVKARVVIDDQAQPHLVYDPGHPDADAKGYVAMPAVDPVLEQADIVSAARSYEANLAVIRVYKDMLARALDIGR